MFHVENTVHKLRRVSLKQPSSKVPVTQCYAKKLPMHLSLISAPFSIKILTTPRLLCRSFVSFLDFWSRLIRDFVKFPRFFKVFVFRKEITGNHGFCHEKIRFFFFFFFLIRGLHVTIRFWLS